MRLLRRLVAAAFVVLLAGAVVALAGRSPRESHAGRAPLAVGPQVAARAEMLGRVLHDNRASADVATLTPGELRSAVDNYWGEGPPTAEKLQIFDRFWQYADAHYAAFQNLDLDWSALRDRYRAEVAAA